MGGESSPETALISEKVMEKEMRLTGNVAEEEISTWVRRRGGGLFILERN